MSKTRPNPNLRRIVLLAAAVLTMLTGYYFGNQFANRQLDPGSLTLLPAPKTLPAFELVDDEGEAFTPASLKDHWTLAFFGYTYCPDICPTTLTRYTPVLNRLQDKPEVVDNTRVLFVSVDPERDTPERLKEYVEYFNPDFQGATGEPTQIAELAKALALFYQAHEPDANGNYLIDHSAAVAIIDPDAQLVGYVNAVLDPQVIASDYGRLVQHFSH